MNGKRILANFDWTLLGLALLIAAIGVLNIYSATISFKLAGTPFYLKQSYWILAGLVLMILVCSFDYHLLEDISYWLYGLIVLLLLVVMVAGKSSMGATRWLHLGFINVQPSEPMKIVIIMVFARYFNGHRFFRGMRVRDLGYPLLLVGIPAVLIMKQPDLGTAIMVLLIAFSLMVFVGVRWSTVASVLVAAVPLCYVGWHYLLLEYQKNRLIDFIDPERDPLGSGYQIIQSVRAAGSGGFLGKGFLHGTQSYLGFLPKQHTDFAFSVFLEELGFAGCLVMLLLYLVLVLSGLHIAGRCNDRFGSLLAMGMTAMIFWHIVINMGMVIRLFPAVGVSLPFFSYGGTSMVTSMVGVGVLLNISMRQSETPRE